MTAICGLVCREPQPIEGLLQEMVNALPLDVNLGQRRTLAHCHGGFGVYKQFPLPDINQDWAGSVLEEDGLYVAAATEIYNAKALRLQLDWDRGNTCSEAALIAGLYRRHGVDCVRQLHGVFAFALWDSRQQRLLLATDPFGVRPVHYCWDGTRLIFGSRLKAILKVPGVPRQIDLNAVYQYFFYSCIPTPYTIYRGIQKLPPGHYLQLSPSGLQVQQYWCMRFEEDFSQSTAYFAQGLRERLAEAVRLHLHYDGHSETVGAFLSGGTDSSTVSGLLGQALMQPSPTFSIGFSEDRFNEIEYARIAARHFSTNHHEYFVKPEDTVALIPRLVDAYDEPFGNASAVPTFYCAQLAHNHGVNVMLAGDGGDELFGGNTRYATDKFFEIYQRLPQWFRRRCFEPLLFDLPFPDSSLLSKTRKYVRRSNIPQPRRFFSYNLLYTVDLGELFSEDFLASIPEDCALSAATDYYQNIHASAMLNRLLNIDLKITITDNDLRKVTRMCELANVKVRYPMLDQELAEFSGKIPAGLKVKGFSKRYIFKEAFKNFLPPEIIAKKKHGFGLPISPWLREEPSLRDLARDTLLSQASRQRGYFKNGFLEHLFELHRGDGTNFFGDNLWVFLMLELWHQSQR